MTTLLQLERTFAARTAEGRTCVPVIGAGVNIQAALQDGARNPNDWDGLLNRVSEEVGIDGPLPPTPLAKWETLLRRWARHKRVEPFKAEAQLQAFVCRELRMHEMSSKRYSLYGEFVDAGFRDIISLNFDRQIALHRKSERFVAPRRRDLLYRHSVAGNTRVWYPHGDTRKSATLKLGVRKYGMLIGTLERERTRIMAASRSHGRQDSRAHWLDLILLGAPLVFIGCGLAADEWPLWWLLHQRARICGHTAETWMLSTKGSTAPHLAGSPSGVQVVEFDSHAKLWSVVRAAMTR